jgi:hypothetical protein
MYDTNAELYLLIVKERLRKQRNVTPQVLSHLRLLMSRANKCFKPKTGGTLHQKVRDCKGTKLPMKRHLCIIPCGVAWQEQEGTK